MMNSTTGNICKLASSPVRNNAANTANTISIKMASERSKAIYLDTEEIDEGFIEVENGEKTIRMKKLNLHSLTPNPEQGMKVVFNTNYAKEIIKEKTTTNLRYFKYNPNLVKVLNKSNEKVNNADIEVMKKELKANANKSVDKNKLTEGIIKYLHLKEKTANYNKQKLKAPSNSYANLYHASALNSASKELSTPPNKMNIYNFIAANPDSGLITNTTATDKMSRFNSIHNSMVHDKSCGTNLATSGAKLSVKESRINIEKDKSDFKDIKRYLLNINCSPAKIGNRIINSFTMTNIKNAFKEFNKKNNKLNSFKFDLMKDLRKSEVAVNNMVKNIGKNKKI